MTQDPQAGPTWAANKAEFMAAFEKALDYVPATVMAGKLPSHAIYAVFVASEGEEGVMFFEADRFNLNDAGVASTLANIEQIIKTVKSGRAATHGKGTTVQ